MCKVGDIIVIDEYKDGDSVLSKHSFVVLGVEQGKIQGIDYNLVANVMSSFKNDEHKKRKMSYGTNFPVSVSDTKVNKGNTKEGYIKADQYYLFDRDKIEYTVIGSLTDRTLQALIEFSQSISHPKLIIDNII